MKSIPTKQHHFLEAVSTFSEPSYATFDLNRLISFTVHWLQQRGIPTTFENIVVSAFKMFPAKFALAGYPEYPDAARVNRALLQLLPKYRNWARGSVQKGFILTESGLNEVRTVGDALSGASPISQPVRNRPAAPRTMDFSNELQSVERSSLFAKWRKQVLEQASVLEFLDMLNAYAYTPPRALRERLAYLENVSAQSHKEELVEFLKQVRKLFSLQLTDESR